MRHRIPVRQRGGLRSCFLSRATPDPAAPSGIRDIVLSFPVRKRAGINLVQLSSARVPSPNPNRSLCPISLLVEFVFVVSGNLHLISAIPQLDSRGSPPSGIRVRRYRAQDAAVGIVRFASRLEAYGTPELALITWLLPVVRNLVFFGGERQPHRPVLVEVGERLNVGFWVKALGEMEKEGVVWP